MFAWADDYDVQATRREARAEGFSEGMEAGESKGKSIISMLSSGASLEKIMHELGVSQKVVMEYAELINIQVS